MTPRQKEALRWLETVGEASEFAVHRAGYQQRTLDALVAQGRVIEEVAGRWRVKPFKVYRSRAYDEALTAYKRHEEAVEA